MSVIMNDMNDYVSIQQGEKKNELNDWDAKS